MKANRMLASIVGLSAAALGATGAQELGPHTARERTAAYELTWSLRILEEQGGLATARLVLEYEIEAFEELYVGDRLWVDGPRHRRVADPFGVYRFVRDGTLWLVFAQAPTPSDVTVSVTYQPLYSRLREGEARRRRVSIGLPVAEYSALARDVDSPSVLEEVSEVRLVVSYRLRSSMDGEPAPPAHESVEAGYIVHDPRYIVSSLTIGALPVRRRTGDMARFTLPGDGAAE